jgi:hypothetical protein
MAFGANETFTPKNISASTNIKASQGILGGFYVNSTAAGTIIIYDDPATGTTTPISGTITPAIGYHMFPACFSTGCYIAVTGGSINLTAFYV